MSDWVHLEAFGFGCRVGLYPGEQDREQPIEASVHLGLDLERAATGELSESVDYARVLEQTEFIGRHGSWRMLESLAVTLARWFLLPPAPGEARAQVNEARIELRKPEALSGRALPRVEVTRHRERLGVVASEIATGVWLERIGETQQVCVYRLRLAPVTSWLPRVAADTRWAWLSIAGNAKVGGAVLEPGARRAGLVAELFPLVMTEAEPLAALVLSTERLDLS